MARWILLAAVLAVLTGCASRSSVDVALVGLAPLESTLLEQRLRLDFRLQNFGQREIRATGLQVHLKINGQQLAQGVDNGGFRIERLGEARVSAVVSTSLFAVARQLLALPDRQSFSYELSGRLYLEGWPRSLGFTRGGVIERSELARLVGAGGNEPAPLRLD